MKVLATPRDRGKRLDALLRERMPEHSRSRLQEWIKAERVRIGGTPVKASYTIRGEEEIEVEPAAPPPLHAVPEEIPLRILYEDPGVVAIDKPAGMVVHAGAGIHSGTLVNALLHRFASLSTVGGEMRPGIVHRLDRFTSGVLLVAKNDQAHRALASQFASRKVRKVYLCMVNGRVQAEHGRIEKPITRDPKRRERMTASLGTGRAAWSEYRVLARYGNQTFLEVLIGTGRTHQIRVHMASMGHPVVGDRLYGAPPSALGRYFLHAHRIEFNQVFSGERIAVESPLAPELAEWVAQASHAG
jgi:23S rRNA pseudouridine1911/1915/1917 synthase